MHVYLLGAMAGPILGGVDFHLFSDCFGVRTLFRRKTICLENSSLGMLRLCLIMHQNEIDPRVRCTLGLCKSENTNETHIKLMHKKGEN